MTEWIPIANIAINLLLLPALKMLYDVKLEMRGMSAKLCAQEQRLTRLESNCDIRHK